MVTRSPIETHDVVLPESGITVTIKNKYTYGDAKAVQHAAFAETTVAAGQVPTITMGSAQAMQNAMLLRLVTAWDVVEADGTPTPLTQENLDDILSENDATFILANLPIMSEEEKKKLNASSSTLSSSTPESSPIYTASTL